MGVQPGRPDDDRLDAVVGGLDGPGDDLRCTAVRAESVDGDYFRTIRVPPLRESSARRYFPNGVCTDMPASNVK